MTHKTIDTKKDPFYQREAAKYEHPIPSREFILEHLEDLGRPASYDHFIRAFNLKNDEQQDALKRRLKAMLRDGQLISNRRGSFALVKQLDLVRGRISAHREGFGFLIPEDGSEKIFLPPREIDSVFNGDKVLVSIINEDQKRGRREGVIVEILERATTEIAGRYVEEDGAGFVTSLNKNIAQDILIPRGKEGGARNGQVVVAKIISYPKNRRSAVGEIIEILGEEMAPGMEVQIAIRSYSLPHAWSEDVLAEIKNFSKEVSTEDKKGRKALQKLPFVTIDGEDAKDFDDAVYCEKLENGKGWRLYVAIADVSHYVKENTALDREAFLRGTSVYFPGSVIPMLPEILSNELCSLKPHIDRLAFVCEMIIGENGLVKRQQFYDAVIFSHARLTYTEVVAMLDGKSQKQPALLPHLRNLHEVYRALKKERAKRGALGFEMPETRIIFGKHRKIQKIIPFERNYAHEIIEECMLVANISTANFLKESGLPVLYRVHAGPDQEKLENLRHFLTGLGLKLHGGSEPKPLDYAKLINQILGRPDERVIQTVLLRSMQQAIYAPANIGHFGLAYQAYTQFTSPIRRYPDLLIHRALRRALYPHREKIYNYNQTMVQNFGEHCSMTERRADNATRDAVDWLKCEYMLGKVGKTYDGTISGVMNFGVFVELKDVYVEGLIHITSLKNDYYKFDPIHLRLDGKRSGSVYKIGDKIRVVVARVDLDERKIDFELSENM